MKRLFFALVIFVFCLSCTKEEEKPTTYQIFNSSNTIVTDLDYLDGSMYEVIVYHYSRSKLIKQDTIEVIPTRGGKTGFLAVPDNADLFKVSFKFLPSISPNYNDSWNARFFLIDYKIIVRGKNNIFGINGGSYIKKADSENHFNFLKGLHYINKAIK